MSAKINFDIIPYVGAGPLRFGMMPDETVSLVGKPELINPTRSGRRDERRDEFALFYGLQSAGIEEMEFYREANVFFQGMSIFKNHEQAYRELLIADGEPFESLGTVVLFNLGVTLSAPDEETKTIAIFAKGVWDSSRDDLKRIPVPNL